MIIWVIKDLISFVKNKIMLVLRDLHVWFLPIYGFIIAGRLSGMSEMALISVHLRERQCHGVVFTHA